MQYSILFSYGLIIFGIVAAILALLTMMKIKKDSTKTLDKLSRNVILGAIIGIIDIAWCVPQAIEIFSIKSPDGIIIAAIICAIIGILFLDYLFTRALAGFLILLAHYFLWQSFGADVSSIWLFSSACLVMGTFGIIIGGVPHLFRDFLRSLVINPKWKLIFSFILLFYAVIGIYYGIVLI